jgi:hypothetical protein
MVPVTMEEVHFWVPEPIMLITYTTGLEPGRMTLEADVVIILPGGRIVTIVTLMVHLDL